MYNSKTYSYEWEDYNEGDKSVNTMVPDILADEEFAQIDELIVGCWGEAWEDSCQAVIDGIIENKEKFAHIKSLFMGDMDYEQCEVSWIIQGNYSKLWEALPNLKELTIKGSTGLELGEIAHENLEKLEIICGGLGSDVIEQIMNAKLPNLKKLNLYLGSDGYGFDGDEKTIENLLKNSDFPKLEYLGINDSEIQDEVTKVVLNSKYMSQISTLDLSNGTLSDEGGLLLLEALPKYPNIKTVDLHFHYLSDGLMKKLGKLPIDIDMDEQNEADEDDGEVYRYAMLTE